MLGLGLALTGLCVLLCVRAGSMLGLALTGLCVLLCVRAGSVLGLGLALTGLCQEGTVDSRTHLATLWDRLGSLLDNTSPQDSTYQVRIVVKTPPPQDSTYLVRIVTKTPPPPEQHLSGENRDDST